MSDKINIVFAADDNYVQHAAVAMVSILKNTEKAFQIQFFLIDDQISSFNKDKISKTVKKWNSNITFLNVKNEALKKGFVSGNLTRAAYFRIDIPNILPLEVEKVIYLDCDLLVLGDISELWNFDMQNQPVAAAEDFGILASKKKCENKKKQFGWTEVTSYFNSGVMLLDLNQWRLQNYTADLLKYIIEKKYRHHDQDALNELFAGNWVRLPLKWNVIPPVFNMTLRVVLNKKFRQEALHAVHDIAIMHFAGGYKPWEYKCFSGFNEWYYQCLALSGYKDVPMPQPNFKKNGHSIYKQLLRLKWTKFLAHWLDK